MVVVGSSSGGRTFLQAVSKIVSEIGEQRPATLLTPSLRITNAMSAVESARDEIYYRTMWKFRRGIFAIELVASQMWYELPEDYHKLAAFVSRNNRAKNVQYVTYDGLLRMYPDMRSFPPGSGIGGVALARQIVGQTHNFGEPLFCTDQDGYIGLMPIPDSDFVEDEGALYAHYWKDAPTLSVDGDDIGIPRSLWEAHHHLALSRLKKVLEFSDWQQDRIVGQRMLTEASSSKGEPMDGDIYQSDVINYNE